jgi:hypothetical protein
MRWVGHIARIRKIKNAHKILVGKTLMEETTRCRWEDNIRIDLREIRCEGVDWPHLAQDINQWRVLVNTVMNLWVP